MKEHNEEQALLAGKTALITGASSGIGEATAMAMAREGACVALAARRTAELERVAEQIESEDGSAVVITTDLRDRDQIRLMVATAVRALGRLDILVNNAGVGYWESIANADIDTWESESRVCIANIFVIPSVPEKETAFRDEALHRHNEKDQ